MSDGFAECSGCGRHVRAADTNCPFCQMVIMAAPRRIADQSKLRMSRAAILASAAIAGACSSGTAVPLYGAPVFYDLDAQPSADASDDAGTEQGDAGSGGGIVITPVYGASPTHDGG